MAWHAAVDLALVHAGSALLRRRSIPPALCTDAQKAVGEWLPHQRIGDYFEITIFAEYEQLLL